MRRFQFIILIIMYLLFNQNLEMEKAALMCISNMCQSVPNAKSVIKLGIVDAIVLVIFVYLLSLLNIM